jgi:integrase
MFPTLAAADRQRGRQPERLAVCAVCGDAFAPRTSRPETCSDTGHGTLWSPEDAYRTFQRACAWPGLAEVHRFHALWHDFASLLARLGVPLRVAMDVLGHSQELMTIYYKHTSDSDRRDAADRVGAWPEASR